ncbi:MAG TPA: hypothetical protein VIF15_14215 [Polyangiaceae bacterium]|jgi:hypothetical protein
MTRATRSVLALLAASAVGSVPRAAHAEPPNAKATPVYVLSIFTDDADDQADALTQSLRSRVRQAQGWSLLETGQSFETLSIALKCPPRPDAPCLQRIADQLHADHYVWGTMARKKTAGEVEADLHLWTRGKPDVEATEGYSDNLKDASDESLRAIASRLFAKLTGSVAGGTLVVHAGTGGGAVLVDGAPKGTLENGVGRVNVPGGPHTVQVRVPGMDAQPQPATVPDGGEQELTFALTSSAPSGPEVTSHGSFPGRKVLEYSAIIAGGGLLVAGGVEAIAWLNDSSSSSDSRHKVPSTINDVCATKINQDAIDACNKSKDAVTVSTLGWIFTGVGAALLTTGIILVTSDHGSGDATRDSTAGAPPRPRVDVLPAVGTRGGAIDLRVTF